MGGIFETGLICNVRLSGPGRWISAVVHFCDPAPLACEASVGIRARPCLASNSLSSARPAISMIPSLAIPTIAHSKPCSSSMHCRSMLEELLQLLHQSPRLEHELLSVLVTSLSPYVCPGMSSNGVVQARS